ncbi:MULTISPECIES: relaxase/mobilization nuclease domain-containing protein [Pedobacter]|uniref:Relaxase/Mobilisation nuclease domain-containing protein n=1 Tax=Pedobacter suwonensis TaxID=332999 RepID=A0A1I0TT97_9SPHI|nr:MULTISPECIES: relaxase/mobilization nuclease domain-containing protein [Pedobacter]SFA55009.1 Relaxase/Mobilisation nuclease domain-containing protein [Pedobacter suwonensis]
MIVKILGSSATFAGVRYNHEKMRSGKGELLKVRNFGSLMGLDKIGSQDYINYLKAVSSVNKRVSKPQFHAVISAKGKTVSKEELLDTAGKWLAEMGYGQNPYLIIFHNDTENNHVHIVSTRIDKCGKKISSAFEKIRSVRALSTVCKKQKSNIKNLENFFHYRHSTVAQMRTLLEKVGFEVRIEKDLFQILNYGKSVREFKLADIENNCDQYCTDKKRAQQLKAIFKKVLSVDIQGNYEVSQTDDLSSKLELLSKMMRKRSGIELEFHSKDAKHPYGYTIIDHTNRSVMKGSEVMPIREILNGLSTNNQIQSEPVEYRISFSDPRIEVDYILSELEGGGLIEEAVREIELKDDVDDEAIHGRNRQRKGKARTNTR